MSVEITSSTVVSPLWAAAENGTLPAAIPVRDEGTFLAFQLDNNTRSVGADEVSFVAFHPVDETCFVFGTTSGKAYGVSLQDNKLFLLADLGSGGALRCGIFCPGYLTSPIVALVKNSKQLMLVDWQRGTVVQETALVQHTQPIQRLVTGPSTESLFCAVSADAISCWEPVGEDTRVAETSAAQQAPPPQQQQQTRQRATGAGAGQTNPTTRAANGVLGNEPEVGHSGGASSKTSDEVLYVCTGSASPTQCTLTQQEQQAQQVNDAGTQAAHASAGRAAHRFLNLHILSRTALLSVESNNILSLWKREAAHIQRLSTPAAGGAGGSPLENEHADPSASQSASNRYVLQLWESVTAPPTLRVRCSAQCGALIALGADAVATAKHGPVVEPVVAFVDAQTLMGTGVVRLPSSTGNTGRTSNNSGGGGAGATGRVAGKAVATVVQVSALQSDLVACLLSTGVVHVVVSSTYHLVFTIRPPSLPLAAVDAEPRASSASFAAGPRTRWCFTPSGPTFGAMYRDQTLLLLHLPTTRKESMVDSPYITAKEGPQAKAFALQSADCNAQERRSSPTKLKGCPVNTSRRSTAPQASMPISAASTTPPVTLAQPFLRHRPTSKPSTLPTSFDASSIFSSITPQDQAEEVKEVEAALTVLAARRPLPTVPKKGFPATWVDVNLIDVRLAESDGAESREKSRVSPSDTTTTTNNNNSSNNTSATPSASRCTSEQAVWSEAKFCDVLPSLSCQYNLEQLQAHLTKYGVFPFPYRPLIWRFLVGLPTKAKTASQFAALARRPPHIAVAQLMQPFPLPPSKTRQAMETALSCICWASPVLTLAAYLPVLVYPLVMLYREDVQTVVELTLLFFANWGREFFLCHPRGPTTVLAAMERELGRLDAALLEHFHAIGATVEVWGWELLTSFYTDVLTGPEWLQVMDHAFATAPRWLFAFHLTLLRTRLRTHLMAAVSADEVRRVLSQPSSGTDTSVSMKTVLEDTYRLHVEWVQRSKPSTSSDEATKSVGHGALAELSSYATFRTLSPRFTYPDGVADLVHDPIVLAEKMRELALVQRSRDEAAAAAKRYATLQSEAEAMAAAEAAFVEQQRARVAAKYDASSAAWQVQLELEQARQQQDARLRRLRENAVQQRTHNAAAVAALHAEMNTVEAQLRHDLVDRHMEELKWGLATHLTEAELTRLQSAAEAQVEAAVAEMREAAAQQAAEVSRFHAEPALQVNMNDNASEAAVEGRGKDERAEDTEEVVVAMSVSASQPSVPLTSATSSASTTHSADKKVQDDAARGSARQNPAIRAADAAAAKEAPLKKVSERMKQRISAADEEAVTRDARRQEARASPASGASTDTITKAITNTSATNASPFESSHDRTTANHEPAPPFLHEVTTTVMPTGVLKEATLAGEDGPTPLSATAQTCAPPTRDDDPRFQPRLHHPGRHRSAPTPRHATNRRSLSSSRGGSYSSYSTTESTVSDPHLQSFVELRNRVLRRLEPTMHVDAMHKDAIASVVQHPHAASVSSSLPPPPPPPQNHRSATEGTTTTTTSTKRTSDTTPYESMSYYTSDTYDTRTRTGTLTTLSEPTTSSKTTSSTSARHLFDDQRRHRDPAHVGRTEPSLNPSAARLKAERPPRHPTTSSGTTTTVTTRSSTSCDTHDGDTPSYSWSYYDYSTGRSSDRTSVTGSFPRTTTSASHSTP